jgi:hypothetical protein
MAVLSEAGEVYTRPPRKKTRLQAPLRLVHNDQA